MAYKWSLSLWVGALFFELVFFNNFLHARFFSGVNTPNS